MNHPSNNDPGDRGEYLHDDLVAALAAADPVETSMVPAPDPVLREEIIAMAPDSNTHEPRRRRAPLVAAAVLMLVVAAGVGVVALDDGSSEPELTVTAIEPAPRTGHSGGTTIGSCMIWDVSALDLTEYAFDGTVTAIDDGWVTFQTNEWFTGPGGDLVTLNAEALVADTDGVVTSVDEVLITDVGQRFLVSGNDGYAGVCNQTQAYSAAEADAWRAHLGG
jgi:hypothetical protein